MVPEYIDLQFLEPSNRPSVGNFCLSSDNTPALPLPDGKLCAEGSHAQQTCFCFRRRRNCGDHCLPEHPGMCSVHAQKCCTNQVVHHRAIKRFIQHSIASGSAELGSAKSIDREGRGHANLSLHDHVQHNKHARGDAAPPAFYR